jgi:hypothetical protein
MIGERDDGESLVLFDLTRDSATPNRQRMVEHIARIPPRLDVEAIWDSLREIPDAVPVSDELRAML